MLQIKLALDEIVRHYSITVNSKTIEPVIASSLDSLLTPITDIYLDFKRIDEKIKWKFLGLWIKLQNIYRKYVKGFH